jgi:hypothetical protein
MKVFHWSNLKFDLILVSPFRNRSHRHWKSLIIVHKKVKYLMKIELESEPRTELTFSTEKDNLSETSLVQNEPQGQKKTPQRPVPDGCKRFTVNLSKDVHEKILSFALWRGCSATRLVEEWGRSLPDKRGQEWTPDQTRASHLFKGWSRRLQPFWT